MTHPHPEDIIVVIDPDNWLLNDVYNWTLNVTKGHKYGQAAYYHEDPAFQRLLKEVCQAGCKNRLRHPTVCPMF
jgi:hypothetical protein